MNKFVTVAALICTLFAVPAAHGAAVYRYSYTFADGSIVNGGFAGSAAGNLITDLSGISAYLNGVAFNGNGSLYAAGLDANGNWSAGTGVASFDGLQNNFLFADSDFPLDYSHTNYFYDTYARTQDAYTESSHGSAWDDLSSAPYVGANWSVTTASEVPEPAPVLLLGLASACLILARRRQRH